MAVEYNQSWIIAALMVLPSIQGAIKPQNIWGILAPSETNPLGTVNVCP